MATDLERKIADLRYQDHVAKLRAAEEERARGIIEPLDDMTRAAIHRLLSRLGYGRSDD